MTGHSTTITVRFSDLDPWGHVNHARYLSYFESARIELLDEIGFGILEMAAHGRQIVLVELTARYHAASNLHDVLDITTRVGAIRRATSHWHQEAHCAGVAVAALDIRAAFTDPSGRPGRPPAGFAEAVAAYSV
ncbi:MAG TPA: thioesterase family protein [Acidimicrobiia bacterium]|nr:thioesterase family protein [Acidimicrobiia bacterium]